MQTFVFCMSFVFQTELFESPNLFIILSLSLNIQGISVRFHPEVLIVGPDPTSGLLTRHFTIHHDIQNTSSISSIDGPLGEVTLEPLDTTTIVRDAMMILCLCALGNVAVYRAMTELVKGLCCLVVLALDNQRGVRC